MELSEQSQKEQEVRFTSSRCHLPTLVYRNVWHRIGLAMGNARPDSAEKVFQAEKERARATMTRLVLILCCVNATSVSGQTTPSSWQEPYVYNLIDYIDSSDCTAAGCNLDDAFDQVITACEAEISEKARGRRIATGCKIYVPAGDHTKNTTLSNTGSDLPTLCRAYSIEGRGGYTNRRPLTRIKMTSEVSFLVAEGFERCRSEFGSAAGAVEIRGLGIEYDPGPKASTAVAIDARAPIRVENVWISYAAIGIRISADVNRIPKTNANVFRLLDVTTEYTRHAGFLIDGGDTNAGAIIAPNINTACSAEPMEMESLVSVYGFSCGGYVDSSFLGNFAIAGHFGIAGGFPDIVIDGESNHGVCIGCYVEGPDTQKLSHWAQWIGGIGPAHTGSGLRLDGSKFSRASFENTIDPNNVVTLELGAATNLGGAFFGARHMGDGSGWPLRLRWIPSSTNYLFDVGAIDTGKVWEIEGFHTGNPTVLGHTTYFDPILP